MVVISHFYPHDTIPPLFAERNKNNKSVKWDYLVPDFKEEYFLQVNHMFLSIITIHPLPGDESRIIDVLDSTRRLIGTNVECQGSVVTVNTAEDGSICYLERWRTREALDRHLRSSLYCRVLEAMELSRVPPMVEFFDTRDIGGLDLVAKARTTGLATKKKR